MGEEEQQDPKIECHPLQPGLRRTPITEAQFLSWKRRKDAISSARKAEAAQKRAEDIAAGIVQMNGRELFLSEPWVFDNTHY